MQIYLSDKVVGGRDGSLKVQGNSKQWFIKNQAYFGMRRINSSGGEKTLRVKDWFEVGKTKLGLRWCRGGVRCV